MGVLASTMLLILIVRIPMASAEDISDEYLNSLLSANLCNFLLNLNLTGFTINLFIDRSVLRAVEPLLKALDNDRAFDLHVPYKNSRNHPKRSLFYQTPFYFTKFSLIGSFNLIVSTCEYMQILDLLDTSNGLKPSEDYTLIYQSETSSDFRLIAAPQLEHFKYKAEITFSSAGMLVSHYCHHCQYGKPKLLPTVDLQLGLASLFPDFTNNFYGKIFRFSTSIMNPVMVQFRQNGEGVWACHGGVTTPILDAFVKKFNCSLEVKPAAVFGSMLPNGTYTGVVGELGRQEIDISVLTPTYDRHFVIHFTHQIHAIAIVLCTRFPKSSAFNAVLVTFSSQAWICVLVLSFVVMLPCFSLFHVATTRKGILNSISSGFNLVLVPIYQQTLEEWEIPKISSVRMLLLSWLAANIIISTAYKSKLRDLMIYGVAERMPETIEDLVHFKDFEIRVTNYRGVVISTLKSMGSQAYKDVYRRALPINTTMDCVEFALKRPKAACIDSYGILKLSLSKNYTDPSGRALMRISPSTTAAFYIPIGLATPKYALYNAKLDMLVQLLHAAYIPNYSLLQDFREARAQGKKNGNDSNPFSEFISHKNIEVGSEISMEMQHFNLLFIVLFLMAGITLIEFVFEMMWFKIMMLTYYINSLAL